MSNLVEIEKLSVGGVFKLVCLSATFAMAPIGVLSALLALFGTPVTVGGVIYTGLGGFWIGLLVAPITG